MKICIIISCFCLIIACKSADAPLQEFVSKEARFAIKYPKGWIFDSSRYAIVQDLQGTQDVFQESVVLGSEQLPLNISADNFAKSFISTMKILDTNFKQLQLQKRKINNVDANELIFSTVQNSQKYKNTVMLFVRDSTGFTIQANATEASYEATKKDCETILKSIQCLP